MKKKIEKSILGPTMALIIFEEQLYGTQFYTKNCGIPMQRMELKLDSIWKK